MMGRLRNAVGDVQDKAVTCLNPKSWRLQYLLYSCSLGRSLALKNLFVLINYSSTGSWRSR